MKPGAANPFSYKVVSYCIVFLVSLAAGPYAWSMCKDGTVSECVVNGKHGTRECVAGRLTPCLVEPDPIPSTHGTVTPKYYILTVIYAPPGTAGGKSSSSVEYSDGSTLGTTVSSTNSFKTDTKVSATASGGILVSGSVGASFGIDLKSSDTSKVEVKKTNTSTIKDSGPNLDGIDHDHDIIYLLLNPKVDVTITGKTVAWNMGYTGPRADIQYLYVGWLRNPSQIPPALAQKLAALGYTTADYQVILRADPFAMGGTAIDTNRYSDTNMSFPYEPPFAAGESVPTTTYQQKNDITNTQAHSFEQSYSVGLSASGEVGFTSLFKTTLKIDNNWTWTNSSDTSDSTNRTQTATVTIGGPAFGYTGPTDIAVYYDTQYNTFMFAPIVVRTSKAEGTIKYKQGRAAAYQEVTLYAGGKRYRTLTNARGKYRFPGQFNGPMEIEVNGAPKQLLPATKQLDFTLPDKLINRPLPLRIERN